MTIEDTGYYRARADEERALAANCDDPSIAKIHFDMAAKYDGLAQDLGARFLPDDVDGIPAFGHA